MALTTTLLRPTADPVSWPGPEDPAEQPWLTTFEVVLGSEERPDLLRWSSQRPLGIGTRDSYALRTPDGLVLVDPADVAPDAAERLGKLLARMGGSPIASVLAYVMHERASGRIRAALGTPVWAPRGRRDVLDEEPDYVFDDGAALPGGIHSLTLTEIHTPPGPEGDSFLRWRAPSGEWVLFSYDRIVERVISIHPHHQPLLGRPGPLLWLREAWLGSTAESAAAGEARFRQGLRRLLDGPFDVVCPGHGALVVRNDPRERIRRVLDAGQRISNFIAL